VADARITETKLMRSHLDMFLLWQVIEYFTPSTFLEIGFAAGQTMGVIYEASRQSGRYVSVDKNYQNRYIFDDTFPEASVSFIQTDSKHLEVDSLGEFEFIHIDGAHTYDMVTNDIDKCRSCMLQKTILYMDDYARPGVNQAIQDEILTKMDWVPFLCGDQGMFFHHMSQSKDVFLDNALQTKAKNFVCFQNENILGHVVQKPRMPNVFVDHPQIFIDTLRAYDL
jgi:predicted O-methyltransferase YrrM